MKRVYFLSGCMLLAAAMAARAADDDWGMLKKSVASARQLPLSGTYLHQMSGLLETFRLYRAGDGDGVLERRESLDGPPREIVRTGGDVVGYAPDTKSLAAARLSAMRLFPALLPDEIDGIAQSYAVRRLTGDRIAQKDCQWFELKPRDTLRYGVRLCLENATQLPLKIMTVSPKSDVVEQYMFTDVEFGAPRNRAVLKPHYRLSYPMRTLATQVPESTAADIEVSGLPTGFRLVRAMKRSLPGQADKQVRQLIFSDGLVMLSLFVEPMMGDPRTPRVSSLHGVISTASGHQGDMQFTLVGDLPEQGMSAVARSLKISRP